MVWIALLFWFVPAGANSALVADGVVSNSIPLQETLDLGPTINPEQREQAQEALRRKMEELGRETNNLPAFEVPALTIKLITGPPDAAELGPPADPAEALRRKLEELSAEENKAGARAALSNAPPTPPPAANAPVFAVKSYEVAGIPALSADTLDSLFAKRTGTNISLEEIVGAASDLQAEYRRHGYPPVSVALAPQYMTKGIVVLSVFQAASPQIVVAGKRYVPPPPVNTNPPMTFPVRAYEITGDTLLSDETLRAILWKYTGTNIGVPDILKAGSELQMEYRDRGYPTVNVTIPPQQITNGIVRMRVFEGQLASIIVTNNHYFSSNNIMRALPGLRTGQVLVGPVFQTELDRANANQDRQIYPQIAPGPIENTSTLILDVKDRLPLHGKLEFDNANSPGTPTLRLNASAAYNNLWQLEHSLGLQYSFSPQEYKSGDQWAFYDLPLVATYSGFYRIPLGSPEPVDQTVTASLGNFGYDEATRKFRLPPSSGQPELNVYASGSAIDTGVQTVFSQTIRDTSDTNGTRTLSRRDVQQDVTQTGDLGARLSAPMPPQGDWQSAFSIGGDYKTFQSSVFKTNTFTITTVSQDAAGQFHTNKDTIPSPLPFPKGVTEQSIEYSLVSWRYDGSVRDPLGLTGFGLGLTFNPWYSGSVSNLQRIAGSRKATGGWVTVTPSLSRDVVFHTNWTLSLHADGQFASQPLISNEQYGAGGVNSVRGYHEGEVFGDNGWRVGIEQKTPGYVVGMVGHSQALVVRGSIYMDFAETYLIEPLGREARTQLWGVGAGAVASVGTHWEARLLFSVPLLGTSSTEAYQPRFNFALTGQF